MGEDDPNGIKTWRALDLLHEQGIAERRMGIPGYYMINEGLFNARGRHFLLKPRRIGNIE
jgi:hypothetical protein